MPGLGARRISTATVFVCMLLLAPLLQAGETAAASGGRPLERLPSASRVRIEAARDRVARVRSALNEESFVSRVSGLVVASGRRVPAVSAGVASSPAETAIAAGLPAALRGPAADLAAAVDQAAAMFDAIPASVARWAMHHQLLRPEGPSVLGAFSVRRSRVRRLIPYPVFTRPKAVHTPGWIHEHRDLGARAALVVAAALDRDLPALRAAADGPPATGLDAVAGCDMLDETPNLCIGSSTDNTYTQDENLLIDLGGNDTYENRAGASYFADSNGGFGPEASVNIDLGGNDTYDPKAILSTPGIPGISPGARELVANGAAYGSGVGILVDAAGDDRYDATAPPTDHDFQTSYTWVQGASGTTLPSFAGLFDLGGSDLYRVQGSSGTNDVEIHAQGYSDGLSAPIGGLVDAGQGDDTYSIDAGTGVGATAGPDAWTQHFAAGQGMGSLGTGVLSDGGGQDSFSLVAHGEWTTTDGYPFANPNEPLTQLPLSETIGQGTGGIGIGMLLEGPGDTTYTAEDTSTGIAYNSVSVQGSGGIGLGVLDDPSGDDTYSATASLTYDHPVTVDDSCTQTDEITEATVPCPSAKTFVHGYNTANFAQLLYAQGFGYLGGQGLLLDAGGNDTYRSTVAATLHTSLHDAMTSPSDRAWFDVWGYGVQWNVGQGVAQGEGSDALLLDAAGNDTYTSHSSTETVAIATSDHAPGTPRVTALAPYRDGVWTQGVGYGISGTGALLDLGGTGDRFDVSSTDTMATSPDTGGNLRASLGWPLAQGAAAGGNATGVFEALGQSPLLSVSPRRGVCPQSPPRGFGGWVDCAVFGDDPDHQPIDYRAVTPAAGFAPFSTGQPTALAFTGDTSPGTAVGHRVFGDDDGATVAVGATLTGPDGKPLAGRLVHFDLQALLKAENVFYKAWFTTWEVDAVTDADGVARAVLPIDDLSAWGFTYADYDFRLLATFDGAAALYPVHTAKAFQLSP